MALIASLDDLKKVIAVCREGGVIEVEADGVRLLLGPPKPKVEKLKKGGPTDYQRFLYAATEGVQLDDGDEDFGATPPPPEVVVRRQ